MRLHFLIVTMTQIIFSLIYSFPSSFDFFSARFNPKKWSRTRACEGVWDIGIVLYIKSLANYSFDKLITNPFSYSLTFSMVINLLRSFLAKYCSLFPINVKQGCWGRSLSMYLFKNRWETPTQKNNKYSSLVGNR